MEKEQFKKDVLSLLYKYEKSTDKKLLQDNRSMMKPVEVDVDQLEHVVENWRELFDDDMYKEICFAKYQLCDNLSNDITMAFYDLHTIELEKDGSIEVTLHRPTARGEMPLSLTTKIEFPKR